MRYLYTTPDPALIAAILLGMVRQPLTAAQIAAGRRLGAALRAARAGRSLGDVALAAGISPETLRKIEAGRLPAPAFGTVVCLSQALDIALNDLAEVWLADLRSGQTSPGRIPEGEADGEFVIAGGHGPVLSSWLMPHPTT